MRLSLTTLFFLAAGTAAHADALFDRYFAAQQAYERHVNAFYIARVPALEGKVPTFTEDPRAQEIMGCTFDYIRDTTGEEGALGLITWLEDAARTEIKSLTDLGTGPEGPAGDAMLGAIDACNTVEITQEIMAETGFMEVFSQPGVMDALMASE